MHYGPSLGQMGKSIKHPWQHAEVAPSRRPKTCGLVVGMHNSGTSLMGALLHAAGVPMGPRLLLRKHIEETKRPSYDYFEDEEVVALQDAHLLRMRRHWSSYRASFALPDKDGTERMAFRSALALLVQRRLRRQRLWVVKDPRTGALLHDWFTVLADLDITPRLLIVHRDPDSNIRSFSRKGQVPALWAEALWQRTYANALNMAQRLPAEHVHMVSFHELLSSPVQSAERASSFLGWKTPSDLEEPISSLFDPSLPTESAEAHNTTPLHPATDQLLASLGKRSVNGTPPSEQNLLATSMAKALNPREAQLQLNQFHLEGQTLCPKLRITIVTAELQGWCAGGGIGSAYLELARALTAAGHPVRILLVAAAVHKPAWSSAQIDVVQLDPSGLSRLEICRAVADCLRNDPGDVIHLHDWLGLGSGLKAALGPNCPPLILGLHGSSAWTRSGNPWPRTPDGGLASETENLYTEGVVRALERDVIQQADLRVSPSSYMAQWVHEHLLNDQPDQALVVQRNCALSTNRLKQSGPEQNEALQPLIYFGRLEERKGLLLFLDALHHLTSQPSEVVFLGSDCQIREGQMGSQLAAEQLSALKIPFRFITSLQRAEALSVVQELQGVLAIPSLIENSPCAVEELLDSELRVVTTHVGGIPELVADESVQWLSEPVASAFAHHLSAALSTPNPEAYRLRARVPGWQIALSWQAFHERFPRHSPLHQPSAEPASLLRRGFGYGQRTVKAALRRIVQRAHQICRSS